MIGAFDVPNVPKGWAFVVRKIQCRGACDISHKADRDLTILLISVKCLVDIT